MFPSFPPPRVPRLMIGIVLVAAIGACQPTAGATPSAVLATASPAPSFDVVEGGTITLTEDGCIWQGNPATLSGAQAKVEITNETDDFGAFFVHRLKPEFTWDDGVAAIAAIAAANEAGQDWPNWAMNVSIVMSEPTVEGGATTTAFIGPTAGTFGVVCSANSGVHGTVLSVFLVGPLEVAAS